VDGITAKVDDLRQAEESLDFVMKRLNDLEDKNAHKALREQSKQVKDQIKELMSLVTQTEDVQGIYSNDELLVSRLFTAYRSIYDVLYPITPTQRHHIAFAKKAVEPIVAKIDAFLKQDWQAYKKAVQEAKLSLL
jgi:hypothetical protein